MFSVGSMLWEAAVGRRMWDGIGEAMMMHRLAIGDIPPPGDYAAVDAELDAIIVKATAASADQRYQSALELQTALEAYVARSGERPSLRQIGATLADSFQTERRRLAEIVSDALKQSLAPPPPPDAPVAPAESQGPRRAPLYVAAGLIVLALIGFAAPRAWRKQPAPAAPAEVAGTPSSAAPLTSELLESEDSASLRRRAPAAAGSAASAPQAVSSFTETTKSARRRHRSPPPSVRASASVAPEPAAPKPPAEDPCNPPYYFVRGIKTYKPECL